MTSAADLYNLSFQPVLLRMTDAFAFVFIKQGLVVSGFMKLYVGTALSGHHPAYRMSQQWKYDC